MERPLGVLPRPFEDSRSSEFYSEYELERKPIHRTDCIDALSSVESRQTPTGGTSSMNNTAFAKACQRSAKRICLANP